MEIDLSGIDTVKDLLTLLKRVYNHELTPKPLKSYIRFELGKYMPDYNIKGFLKED